MAARETYHHGDLRRALLESGLELLDETGQQSISLRAVARRAGVSHAAPYHHFADKNDLFRAMAGLVARHVADELIASTATARHLGHAVQLSGIAYIRYAVRNPARFRLLSDHPRPEAGLGDTDTHPLDPDNASARVLIETLTAGQKAGYVAEGDPRTMALTAWATAHGLATLLLDGMLTDGPPTEEDAVRLGTAAVKLMGTGFAPR